MGAAVFVSQLLSTLHNMSRALAALAWVSLCRSTGPWHYGLMDFLNIMAHTSDVHSFGPSGLGMPSGHADASSTFPPPSLPPPVFFRLLPSSFQLVRAWWSPLPISWEA